MNRPAPHFNVWYTLCQHRPLNEGTWYRVGTYFRSRFGVPTDHEGPYHDLMNDIWRLTVACGTGGHDNYFGKFLATANLIENYSISAPIFRLRDKKLRFQYAEQDFFVSGDPLGIDITVTNTQKREIEHPEVREYAEAWLHYLS